LLPRAGRERGAVGGTALKLYVRAVLKLYMRPNSGPPRFEQASRERDTVRELKAMGWRAESGAKQTQHAEARRTRSRGNLMQADVVREMRQQVVAATTQRRITTGARTRHRLTGRGCSARGAEHGRQVLVQE